jgi:hypothetical protein
MVNVLRLRVNCFKTINKATDMGLNSGGGEGEEKR